MRQDLNAVRMGGRNLVVKYRAASALIPFSKNARTHSDAQVAQIAASIREFGWTNPILVDGDNGYIVRARGYAERKLDELLLTYAIPINLFGHLQRMIDTQQPCLIPDTWAFEQWFLTDESSYPNWLVDQLGHYARSYLGAPILLDSNVIGFINLESDQPDYFTPTDADSDGDRPTDRHRTPPPLRPGRSAPRPASSVPWARSGHDHVADVLAA
jgi:hypothetical protein